MKVAKGVFDGKEIKLLEPILTREKTNVLIIFPDKVEKYNSEIARKFLRGRGKGEKLTEKLLKSRQEDISLERR